MSDINKKDVGEKITAAEAAEMLGVSVRRIQWLIETGKTRSNVKDGVTYVYEGDVKRYGRSRFIKKNRMRIAVVAALTVALAVGMAALGVLWQDRENAEKYMEFAEESIKRGDFNEADVYLRKVESIKRRDAEALNEIALLYMNGGRVDRAVEVFEKAEGLEAGNRAAVENLCALYFMKGQKDKAERMCERALEGESGHVMAMFTLGRIYAANRDYEKAEKMYEAALEKSPDFFPAQEGLAAVYSATKRFERAEEIYEGGEGAPMFNRLNLAIQKDKAGEHGEAVKIYNEIISNAPALARAYNNIAWGFAANEKATEKELAFAFEMAKKALTLAPEDPAAIDTMGWIFYQRKMYEESEKLLEKSVELDGGDPVALAHLIRTKFAMGKSEEVEKLLNRLSTLDPEGSEILSKLLEQKQ